MGILPMSLGQSGRGAGSVITGETPVPLAPATRV